MKKTNNKSKTINKGPNGKGRNKHEQKHRRAPAMPMGYYMAIKFIQADTVEEKRQRVKLLNVLIECSSEEFYEHYKRSKGNNSKLLDIFKAYQIRLDWGRKVPDEMPYPYNNKRDSEGDSETSISDL